MISSSPVSQLSAHPSFSAGERLCTGCNRADWAPLENVVEPFER